MTPPFMHQHTLFDHESPVCRLKGLSLWDPWATLVAIGAKQQETRSWATSYRGPLVIHVARRWNAELADQCRVEPFAAVLAQHGFWCHGQQHNLPLGCVVALVQLVDCIQISATNAPPEGSNERAFGNYAPGRWMWRFEQVQRLPTPLPWRGAQGLWSAAEIVGLLEHDHQGNPLAEKGNRIS